MPTIPLPEKKRLQVLALLAEGKLTHEQIAQRVGCGTGTVSKYKAIPHPTKPAASVSADPLTHEGIRKALRRGSLTLLELADATDAAPKAVLAIIAQMKARGAMLLEQHGRFDLADSIHLPPGETVLKSTAKGSLVRRFGVTGDNHLCNRHARLDVLKAAYDHFEREGITEVFNTGNWIDGEARFNKTELLTSPGMDSQIQYMIDNFPQRKGITTRFIAGDDHEGWYQQREGIEVGRYLEMSAQKAGRKDLVYLGYGECDVKLQHGTGSACMRVVHPGGGSSYAISYTDQKRVESYQGGEKPQIELAGHYHKFNYGYPREVHCVQTGTTCDQSLFMRKKKLQAHVGFLTISITQDEKGCVTRFSPEWFPFFDRGFYETRFN